MRILKYVLYGVGGIVLLVVLAIVAALVIVDGNFVKNRLERKMKEERQRTLRIEGVPKVSVFPRLSLSFGKTTLSERASEKEFLSFDSMSASVGVLPLLSNQVAIDAISLTGLRVNVIRARDGTFNFANLTGDPDERPPHEPKDKAKEELKDELKELPKVRVDEVKVERAQITYRDEETGQDLRVSDLNLKTGRLEDDTPSDVTFSAHVTGKNPDVDLRAELKGAASLNLAKRTFALAKLDGKLRGVAGPVRGLDGQVTGSLAANPGRGELNASEFSIAAKGSYEKDAFTLLIAAPQLAVTTGKAAGKAVTADLRMKGPSRNVDAKFRLEGLEGTAEALSIAALALDLDAAITPNVVKGKISTPVKGNLKARSWELPKIVADLTITSPQIPQKTVTLPLRASAKANLEKRTASAELNTTFDESTIQAKFGATKLDPLVATFDLKIDRLNLDRYLPPAKKESNPTERLDLSALKGRTATGKAEIGSITVRRVKLSNVKADIKLAGGKLEVSPHSANLYGGTLAGSLGADANGNRITIKETIQGVQVGPLLRDAVEQDRLEGRGNVNFDVAMAGPSIASLKKSMGGSARVEVRDGAVKGINLGEAISDVRSVIGKGPKTNDPSKRTDFSEITASFTIKNGVAHNQDLQGKAPLFRLSGAGDIDVGNSTLNYGAKASLVATSKGQGGRELPNLTGVTIPVKVTGPLEKPDITVDFAELIAKSGVGLGKALGSVGGAAGSAVGGVAGSAAGGVKDKLKGLFGR